jgi:hypothetical protein
VCVLRVVYARVCEKVLGWMAVCKAIRKEMMQKEKTTGQVSVLVHGSALLSSPHWRC